MDVNKTRQADSVDGACRVKGDRALAVARVTREQ